MIFSHPQMLWALTAIAIPIIIHLVNINRYKRVYFSNVEHLSNLQTESRRRNTLRQLLVLAMRILAIVGLVMAFAGPILPRHEQQLRSGATAVSIYIDNSFSMENASSEGSQIELAKQKAREIAAAYGAGDLFQLIDNDLTGSQRRWMSRDELLEAIDQVEVSAATRSLDVIVGTQQTLLLRTQVANRHAYIVSDFQSSTSSLSALESDSSIALMLVPLPAIATDNLYIDTVVLDAPAFFVGSRVVVEVVVGNSGSRDAEKIPLKLLLNGHERALATLDIPAGSTAKTQLQFTLDQAGWTDGRVEIADYPITFDDHYHFALLAGEPIRAALIESAPNPYLHKLFEADSVVSFRFTSPSNFDPTTLSETDFIILNELRSLSSGLAHELQQWTADGGTLLIAPPAEADCADLNQLLASLQAPTLERWVAQPIKGQRLDVDNSLFRNVFSTTTADLEMPILQAYYRLATGSSIRHPLLTLADGSDYLIAVPHGSGILYLFTAPLTDSYTDFVGQALFVPTLYNMALYSRPAPPIAYTLGSSQPIVLQQKHPTSAPLDQLTDEAGASIIPDLRSVANHQILVPHADLDHDGIYLYGGEHIAFNYDRRESHLDFLDPADIASQTSFPVIRNADKPLDQEIRTRHSGKPLWRWFIVLSLVALAAEGLLLYRKHDSAD